MGEIAKRTDEEQVEIEDQVLTLTEAGWTQRDIVNESGIAFKSIAPYKERALSRMTLPDSETVTKSDVLFYDNIIREGIKMLRHPELGPSATNRPLSSQRTRGQIARTVSAPWDTNKMVTPCRRR